MKNARLDKWKLLTAAVVWLAIGVAGFVYFYDLNPERRISDIVPLKAAYQLSDEAAAQVVTDLNAVAASSDAVVDFPAELAGIKTSEAALGSYLSDISRQLTAAHTMAIDYSTVYNENGEPVEDQTKFEKKNLTFSVSPSNVGEPEITFGSGNDILIRLPILVSWKGADNLAEDMASTDVYTHLVIDGDTGEIKQVVGG